MGSTRNRRPWRILKGTKAEQRQGNRTNNLLLPALVCDFVSRVKINLRRFDLKLAHRWAIARSVQAGGSGGTDIYKVVFVELTDADGTTGIGEAAPSPRYAQLRKKSRSALMPTKAGRRRRTR